MVRYFLLLRSDANLSVIYVSLQNGGKMTLIIGIITTIITILIVALEAMIGYERGIRKNLIRVIMLFLVAVLTFFITPPVVEYIVRKLILTNKLYDYLYTMTGVNMGTYSFLRVSAVNLFTVFLNPFVYVILFWIGKLLSFGIYLLLDRYILKKKLPKLFPCPTKKSSIAGGVLGGFYAILIGAIFFMPISAYSELLQNTEKAAVAEGEAGTVSELFGVGNYSMAISYQRTPSYYFYKYTGSKYLGDAMFSALSEKKIEEATVSVDRSITSIVRVYHAAKLLKGAGNATAAEDMEGYIGAISVIVDEFAGQDIVSGTDQEKLTLMKDVLDHSTAISDNNLLKTITSNMEYASFDSLQQDLQLLTEFTTLLNEKELLTDILDNYSRITTREAMDKLEDEMIVRIADILYSMDRAEFVVPVITEKLLTLLLGDGQAGGEALNRIENFGDSKQEFIEVCRSGKKLAYLMNNTIEDEEAKELLEESLTILRNTKLISNETLLKLERILAEKLKLYRELEVK
jgi:hypothetical protein